MCGLSAVVDFAPKRGVLPALLAMHDRIVHRGPDGEGFAAWDVGLQGIVTRSRDKLQGAAPANARVGAAFRWLKIQDPHEFSGSTDALRGRSCLPAVQRRNLQLS